MTSTCYFARAEEERHQVPLFDEGVLARVPVNAFGQTLYFTVDSGFTVSAIDTKFKSLLGEAGIVSFDGGTPLGTPTTSPGFQSPELLIAGKRLALDKIMCLDLKMPRLVSGQQCDGILGADFFAKKVVSFDFEKDLFSLLQAVPDSVRSQFTAIPLQQTSQFFTMEVTVDGGKQLTLMVDTGDSSSISLNADAWQEVFGDSKTNGMAVTVSDAANHVARSRAGLIGNLAVGTLNYTNLHATLLRDPKGPSHLGLGFFRRHKTIFDFGNRMLYIEPNGTFSTPDKEDMSGLHLLREGDTTFVYSVDGDSPAFTSGIKPRDVIESVNGQETVSLTMKVIREMLQSHDGDRVALKIRRDDEALKFQFALKQAL